jgi:hypothetical protein
VNECPDDAGCDDAERDVTEADGVELKLHL